MLWHCSVATFMYHKTSKPQSIDDELFLHCSLVADCSYLARCCFLLTLEILYPSGLIDTDPVILSLVSCLMSPTVGC